MIAVVIDSKGLIVNRIMLEEEADWPPPEGCTTAKEGDIAYAIGGTLIGGVYVPPPVPQVTPFVPERATKLGLKRAFDELGIWPQVKAEIAADRDAQEEWDLAIDINRTDPLTQNLIRKLQFSDAQVDQIIIRANALV